MSESQEIKNIQWDEEPVGEKADDEMDVSDEDEPTRKKQRYEGHHDETLKEENLNLKCQLEAYKNEVRYFNG